jgi:hypothetical protein
MTNAEALLIPNAQSEFFAAGVRHAAMATLQPEKRLMLAVLEHAVEDFRTYAFVATERGRRLFMEVDAWFRYAATGPFDFEGICQATGLEPGCIRKCLRNWYDSAASAARFDSRATKSEECSSPDSLSESA